VLAVVPAASAAATEPGLSVAWPGPAVVLPATVGAAALLGGMQDAADQRAPLVIDCTDRDQAGALLAALAVLSGRTGLALVVTTHGARPCQVRAVAPGLTRRRWWRFWTTRPVTGHAA